MRKQIVTRIAYGIAYAGQKLTGSSLANGGLMASMFTGRKLSSQIVLPLAIASLLAGLIATAIAVYSVSSLTNRWVDQIAEYRLMDTQTAFRTHVRQMEYMLELLVMDDDLVRAVSDDDLDRVADILGVMQTTLHYDGIEMWSATGELLTSRGISVAETATPQATNAQEVHGINTRPAFRKMRDGRLALTVSRPLVAGGEAFEFRLIHAIDRQLIREISGGAGESAAIYDAEMRLVAYAIDEGEPALARERQAIGDAYTSPDPAILSAVAGIGEIPRHVELRIPYGAFGVRAADIALVGAVGGEENVYLVTLSSLAVSQQARSVTLALIGIWSALAAVTLTALGFSVGGRVSDSLKNLASGAKRIAEGDFSTKIDIQGSTEVMELAGSFNDMTDSLRERTESLTKRILEIATLYEMSKTFGSTLDMDALLDYVLDSSLHIFSADVGYVTMIDSHTGRLELKAWRCDDRQAPGADALQSSLSEWVVREGRPLIFNPAAEGAPSTRHDTVTGALAAMCVPLVTSEGTFGAITIGHLSPGARFSGDDVRLMSTIANHANIAMGNIELIENLEESYLATVRSLAMAVDAKDPYTRGHSDWVAKYASCIADYMGLSRDQAMALETAAYLHDIGKIGIRDEILLKPGALTDEEMSEMRHHPLIGANILKPVGFPWSIAPVVRHHHERWDGTGYPAGLKGEEIPFLARVLGVADAFEAMTSDRPYRMARTPQEAIEELRLCAGTHFDPDVVEDFTAAIEGNEGKSETIHDIQDICPEETQAVFIVLVEGLITSFSKLAGPRLAARTEIDINAELTLADLPYRMSAGKLVLQNDDDIVLNDGQYWQVLAIVDEVMERVSGTSLLEQYHADALGGLSMRMRLIAERIGFCSH